MQKHVEPSKFHKSPTILAILVLLALPYLLSCDKNETSQQTPKGFTFLDVGRTTVINGKIKRELEAKLGHSVLERWRTIDLEINYKGFIERHFPDLHRLHRKLKTDVVLETEDNPVRLTYRHTRKKETPFEYVELVYSGHTRKPLMFRIKLKQNRTSVVDVLREKHGTPEETDWDEKVAYGKKGRSLHWLNDKDMLIVSLFPDRYGISEHHIAIYYIGNMEEALRIKQDRERRKKDEAVKDAF